MLRSEREPIIDKLNAAIGKAMKDQGVTSRLADVGTEAVGSTVAETDAFTRQQFTLYSGIVERDKSLLGGQ